MLETLEGRDVPVAAVSISAADALSFTANATSIVTVSYASGVYTISDSAEMINVTNNGTGTVTGNGTSLITVTNNTSLDFDLKGTAGSLILDSNSTSTTLHDSTGGGDYFQIGSGGTAQNILGAVTIGSTTALSTAEVDDQSDTTGRTVTVSNTSVTGLAPVTIDLTNANLSNLSLFMGSGVDTTTVTGTKVHTTLQGNTLGDTVNVQGTNSGATLIVGGTQGETINIGNAGSVQGLLGDVTISNNNNGSTITVDDSADTTARTVSIGSVTTTGLAPASLNFLGSEPLTIKGGSGGNTFTFTGTPGGPTTLDSGTGNDTVNVHVTDAGRSLTIHGQNGTDIVNIGDLSSLSGISSAVTIDNASGSTALTIDDSADASATTANLNATQLTGAAPATITYANLSSLSVLFGTAADTVNVTATPTAATTTVTMGSSTSNMVNLGDATHAASSLGDVTVTGTTGLTVDDSADATAQTVAITSSNLTIGTSPTFDYSGATLQSLAFNGGSGANTVNVTSTPAGVATTLAMGNSTSNMVNLGDASNAASGLGDVTITGTTGLEINNTADATAQTVAITSSSLTIGTSPTFDYSGAILLSLAFDGGSGANTVTVTGAPTGITPTLAMGSSMSNMVNLGDATHAASSLGDVTVTGTTGLTVDDAAGTAGQTVTVKGSDLMIGSGPDFTYSPASLVGLVFDASNSGSTTVNVSGTPALSGAIPLTLNMGTGTGNLVDFGNRADSYGNVTVTTGVGGTTGLTIDDSSGNGSWTIGVTATETTFAGGPTYDYSGATLSSMTLNVDNDGGNTVNVTGTPALPPGSPLSISAFTGTGNAINLGDATHAASSLGDVMLGSGGGGPLAVTIDDSADAAAQTVAITSSSLTIGASPTFDYSGATLQSLAFDSGSGANTVTVTGTPTGITPTLAMGSSTSNMVNLGDATHAASSLGDVTVTGTTGLTVDDSADATAQTVAITGSSLTIGVSPTFDYSGATLQNLTFDSGSGANTVNVTGTPNATTLAMGSSTSNVVKLGDATHAASGLGSVTVTGTTGLTVDDSADATARAVVLTSSSLTIDAAPVFTFSGATLQSLTFDSGSGANTVTVTGAPIGITPTLTMGSSTSNMVKLGDATHAVSSLGNVTVTGTTALKVDDSADITARTVTIAASSLTINAAPVFTYSGATLQGLIVDGGSGGDTFTVNNAGTNTYPTSIVGGSGNDTFKLLGVSTLGAGGTIDGGAGVNTLDYTGYTAPVTVNLVGGNGTATGTSGVFNIQNVIPSDLTITLSHAGNFRQGNTADTYTVTVGNRVTVPLVGTVTVTVTLPTGLSPTSADNGTINGWTVTFSGQIITATRSDALAAGASYPPLTLTVSVAVDAPTSVTTMATVSDASQTVTTTDTTTIDVLLSGPVIGSTTGSQVTLPGVSGGPSMTITPFVGFDGEVRVASADVNGDGVPDVIVGAGPGAPGGHVKVFDGKTGAELMSFFTFDGFTGGVFVGAGDVNGDGTQDIIVGAGAGAPGGHVKVFDGKTGAELMSFFAFDGFTGGVRVAGGDINGDGFDDVIVGAGAGAPGGHVKVFDGKTGAELMSFFAFDGFTGGVFVGVADLDGNGTDEVVVGADAGADPHVKAFSADGQTLLSFLAYDASFHGGVRVGGFDLDGDGQDEIVTGSGPGAPGDQRYFDANGNLISAQIVTAADALGGIYVG